MRYGEFKINQAENVRLCNDLFLGDKLYFKGHILTQEDIVVFKSFKIYSVFGVIFEEGDVDYKTAQHQIAAQVSGKGLGYITDDSGVCKIVATSEGIFISDESRIDKFNRANEHIVLNIVKPYRVVKSGDIVAELEVVPPLITEAEIDDIIFRLSGNESLLRIDELRDKKAVLLYTHLLNDENENRHFTSVVMKLVTNLTEVGLTFEKEINTAYRKDALTDALFDTFKTGADVVFVLTPVKTSGRHDIVVSSMNEAVDDIDCFAFPKVGASDFLIAQKGKVKIITVPFNYDIVDTKDIDETIKKAIFVEHLNEAYFNHKVSATLDDVKKIDVFSEERLIMSQKKTSTVSKANIAVVVLAAGQSRRAGKNKLMVEDEFGQPMFLRAVNAAIASKANPVFVVTGYRHEELAEWLDILDINVLYNPSFAMGIKTSINMGLKSVPSACDGVILLPADMPNITATDLNKLINKFDKNEEKQVCLFSYKGTKSNPVLWSRSLYDRADIVPENSSVRAVFVEHADYTNIVETKDKKKLIDVNFPNDVDEFAKV